MKSRYRVIHSTLKRIAKLFPAAIFFADGVLSANMTAFQEKILKDLSWNVKLKLLNELTPTVIRSLPIRRSMDKGVINIKQGFEKDRPVGIQALTHRRQEEETPKPTLESDENVMRLKLFRLMYETVRDSDMKVKRADQIRAYYVNSTAFEIGYLIGDITDKYNVMADIAATLQRLYNEWRPIEHINAYEQIASQAIEISHLIDIARHVSKRQRL